MTKFPLKPDPQPANDPTLDDDAREEIRRQAAKDALRQSFEHGAPETGPGDDLDFERGNDQNTSDR